MSRLCLGTMNFGSVTSEDHSVRILDRSLELGFNFIDTANYYGNPVGTGVTEGILGRWLKKKKGAREKIVLATKVYTKTGEGVNDGRLSAYHIRKACDDSLKRLQTDHIDLYQMHHIDRRTPWDEIWQAMEQLVREGKVIYVGSSNFAGWDLATAAQEARKRNFLGIVSEQSRYNLTLRHLEHEVIPACRHYGIGILPWSPLGGGYLAGVLGSHSKSGRRGKENIRKWVQKSKGVLETWEALCQKIGEAPALVAVAWLLHQEAVTAPVIGPRTVEQLEKMVKAIDIRLDQNVLGKIDEIFPPAGEAPKHYAW